MGGRGVWVCWRWWREVGGCGGVGVGTGGGGGGGGGGRVRRGEGGQQ